MAFSDSDLAGLADDFAAKPGAEIVTPRAVDRRGGQSGFSHFERAVPKAIPTVAPRKCRRCRLYVECGVLCPRHKEQARQWGNQRNRRKGIKEWQPGGKGRPPRIVRAKADAELVLQESMLADALHELAALQRRIAHMRGALTQARREHLMQGAEAHTGAIFACVGRQ